MKNSKFPSSTVTIKGLSKNSWVSGFAEEPSTKPEKLENREVPMANRFQVQVLQGGVNPTLFRPKDG